MKNLLLLLFFNFASLNSFAQCNYPTLLNGIMGNSLYDCYNILQLNKDAIEVTKNPYQKYWEAPKYLNGDSVYKTQIDFKLKGSCFYGNELIDCRYSFVDDKLYCISVKIHISKSQYEQAFETYNKFISEVRKENRLKFEFPFEGFNTEYTSKAEEKIGEGIRFYISESASKECKLSYVSISLLQEFNWDRNRQIHTDVKEYIIQLEKVNLKQTKLTCKGF